MKNASRVKFEVQGKHSVTQVPDYAPPPDINDFDQATEIDLPYNAWIPPKSERQITEEKHRAQKLQDWKAQQAQIRADLEQARITPREPKYAAPAETHVGTAALRSPGREATVPAAEADKSAQAPPPTIVPPHNFKPTQTTRTAPATPTNSGTPIRKPRKPQPRLQTGARVPPMPASSIAEGPPGMAKNGEKKRSCDPSTPECDSKIESHSCTQDDRVEDGYFLLRRLDDFVFDFGLGSCSSMMAKLIFFSTGSMRSTITLSCWPMR